MRAIQNGKIAIIYMKYHRENLISYTNKNIPFFLSLSIQQLNKYRWSMRAGGTTSPSLQSSWTR